MKGITQRYGSPLRYPGGKAKVANFLKLVLLENDLVGADYVEPYAGGASVALALLFEDYVSTVRINDLNPGIHAFWRSVLDETDALCDLVRAIPLTVPEWRHQRQMTLAVDATTLERGFATFYLNRTNRSGIIAGGGVIGGLDQTGPWKIDARFTRDELVRRIRKVARFRSRIDVTTDDALALLSEAPRGGMTGSCLYFLDPPYYVKGEGLYDNFYRHDDHVAIRDAVAHLDQPWVVSYDAAPQILEMYGDHDALSYSSSYSANTRQMGAEVMFTSPGLILPDGSPFAVPAARVEAARHQLFLPF